MIFGETLNGENAVKNWICWLENCWGYHYYEIMRRAIEQDVCPFCKIKEPNRAVLVGMFWTVIENAIYKENPSQHQPFVLVLKRHPKDVAGFVFKPEEGAELFSFFNTLCGMYNIRGGGLALRFGDRPDLSGATLKHPHAHLIRPTGKGSVLQVFGKPEEVREAQIARMEVYARVYAERGLQTERDHLLFNANTEEELVRAYHMNE